MVPLDTAQALFYPVPAQESIRLITDAPHWYEGINSYILTDALGNRVACGAFFLSPGEA